MNENVKKLKNVKAADKNEVIGEMIKNGYEILMDCVEICNTIIWH